MRDDELLLWLGLGALVLFALAPGLASASGSISFDPNPPNASGDIFGMNAATRVSSSGRAFIKGQETLQLVAYPDGDGGHSIGYGHYFPPGVAYPETCTETDADAWFESDLASVESTINSAVRVQLSQGQFDALGDFVFNEGAGHFLQSTLLRKLNLGDYAGAADEFSRWNLAQGKINQDLVARRAEEKAMFGASSPGTMVAAGTPTDGTPTDTVA